MKCLERNKTEIYYALYERDESRTDEYGNASGERRVIYSESVKIKANVSPATGVSQVEQFGRDMKYDKVIVLDDVNCPIDENTVFFIDKEPSYDSDGNPLFDYIVKKIARSINSVSIAVSKVDVS